MIKLTAEINRTWDKICHGHSTPVFTEELLIQRVKWIAAQCEAAETNFSVTNKAYCRLDLQLREVALVLRWWAKLRARFSRDWPK